VGLGLWLNASLPYVANLKDFIAAAKAQSGKINIGSAGSGSGTQLIAEELQRWARVMKEAGIRQE
jgi:tripartite-type tricarboxylate transporter receptor subunit TctC